MIDISKKYRTRDGRTVSNLSLRSNREDCFPVTGNIEEYGNQSWDVKGKYYGHGSTSSNDLVEVTPEVTLDSLVAAGFDILVARTTGSSYVVELSRSGCRARVEEPELQAALQRALDLWEVNNRRDYTAVLYVLPNGIVTTNSPFHSDDPKPIARKVVRFTAKSGDVE